MGQSWIFSDKLVREFATQAKLHHQELNQKLRLNIVKSCTSDGQGKSEVL